MSLHYGSFKNRINVLGHEGDTYGFLSSEGYAPSLKGAFSVASNVDVGEPLDSMACFLLQIVGQTIGGSSTSLDCMQLNEKLVFV